MNKVFEWGDKKYKIDRLRLWEMKEYLHLAKQLAGDLEPSAQLDVLDDMFKILHCPPEVHKELYADQARDCIAALERAHFGEPEAGDSGNVGEGGAVAH
jgi:hypothetical protein